MSTLVVPQVASGLSNEELADLVAKMSKELDWFSRNIDSQNVRNIAGYNVSEHEMKHISGIVGMSGFDAANPNAVRFWSGSADKANAPFRVTQAGVMTAVGGEFRSAAGYPRVEINSVNNLIAAYTDPDTYISFLPSYNLVPALVMVDVGTIKAFLNRGDPVGGTTLGTFDNEALNFQPSGPLRIGGVNGFTGDVMVVTGVNFTAQTTTTQKLSFTKGIRTS